MPIDRTWRGVGATAVQLAEYAGGRDRLIEHLGSAHTEAELAVLLDLAHAKLHEGQDELDLELGTPSQRGTRGAGTSLTTTDPRDPVSMEPVGIQRDR